MPSFVSTREVHVAALKNPAMLGDSFINHPVSKVPEIKELMNRTTDECASMLELADAIKSLDTMVQAQPWLRGLESPPIGRQLSS